MTKRDFHFSIFYIPSYSAIVMNKYINSQMSYSSSFVDICSQAVIYTQFYHNFTHRGWTLIQLSEDVVITYFQQPDRSSTQIIKYTRQPKSQSVVYQDLETHEWNEVFFEPSFAIVDLNTTGRRWEGEIENNQPNGWGKLYNEEGWLQYEGFMRDGYYDGFGKLYGTRSEILLYDGMFCYGKRYGKGIAYNLHSQKEYEGVFYDDPLFQHSAIYQDHCTDCGIASCILDLTIGEGQLKELEGAFNLKWFPQLQHIHFLPSSCQNTHTFIANSHPTIQTITIDHHSFGSISSSFEKAIFRESVVEVRNCPMLQSMTIAYDSFLYTSGFSLISMLHWR